MNIREQLELDKQKYFEFLAIKRQVLKQIKEQELDKMGVYMKKRKQLRLLVGLIKQRKVTRILIDQLKAGKQKLIMNARKRLFALRIYLQCNRFLKV